MGALTHAARLGDALRAPLRQWCRRRLPVMVCAVGVATPLLCALLTESTQKRGDYWHTKQHNDTEKVYV